MALPNCDIAELRKTEIVNSVKDELPNSAIME